MVFKSKCNEFIEALTGQHVNRGFKTTNKESSSGTYTLWIRNWLFRDITRLTGMVLPKMKMLSSMLVIKHLMPLTSIDSRGKKSTARQLFDYRHFLKIFSLLFNKRKKLIEVWNNFRGSKWRQHFHFGWTISLSLLPRYIVSEKQYVNYTLRKKAVTGAVPFQKVHFCPF